MMGLSFDTLRQANRARIPEYKNAKGETYHLPDGADWSPNDWVTATMGELGEAANLLKKVRRGDLTLDEARPKLAKEFADVVTYLDILALNCGIDLGQATVDKFNEVSERVGARTRISAGETDTSGMGVYAVEAMSPHTRFHKEIDERGAAGGPKMTFVQARERLHQLMPTGGSMCLDCLFIYNH